MQRGRGTNVTFQCRCFIENRVFRIGDATGGKAPMTREEVYQSVQALMEEKDLFAASAFVLGPWRYANSCCGVRRPHSQLLPQGQVIAQVLHFAVPASTTALAAERAHDGKDDAATRIFVSQPSAMATNVASFTWPGVERTGNIDSDEQMGQASSSLAYSVRQLHEPRPNFRSIGVHLLVPGCPTHWRTSSTRMPCKCSKQPMPTIWSMARTRRAV